MLTSVLSWLDSALFPGLPVLAARRGMLMPRPRLRHPPHDSPFAWPPPLRLLRLRSALILVFAALALSVLALWYTDALHYPGHAPPIADLPDAVSPSPLLAGRSPVHPALGPIAVLPPLLPIADASDPSPTNVAAVAVADPTDVPYDPYSIRRPPVPNPEYPASQSWVASHVVFFLHVPKTAGQSFITLLRFVARPYELTYRKRHSPQAPRLDLTFMQRKAIVDVCRPEERRHFSPAYARQMVHLGHADVLIREAFRHGGRQTEFVTMARDPVERVLSHYCYIVQNASDRADRAVQKLSQHRVVFPTWVAYVNRSKDVWSAASFRQFVLGQQKDGVDNWHVRAMAGCLHTAVVHASDYPALCESPEAMLAEARRQMERFLFLGLTEHYEESAELLLYTLNYDPNTYRYRFRPYDTVNKNRKKKQCVTDVEGEDGGVEVRALVASIEYLDVQLYAYAKELFWARWKLLPEGPWFEDRDGAKAKAANEAKAAKRRTGRGNRPRADEK